MQEVSSSKRLVNFHYDTLHHIAEGNNLLIMKLFLPIKKKINSVALIREQTIPTKRLPLVGEVSANSKNSSSYFQSRGFFTLLISMDTQNYTKYKTIKKAQKYCFLVVLVYSNSVLT
jgi:hypothetical protein